MKTAIKLLLLFVVFCSFFMLQQSKITVHLVGDSTIADKETKTYPETGWGMPFRYFFDSSVQVVNHAKNGRSTKSFRDEGLWQPVVQNLRQGDYVFIQFGHNDEVKEKVGRYTTPQEFRANLEQYLAETKQKGAQPVLLTPVARRKFDESGKVVDTHPVYSDIVRSVAKEKAVPLIDLDAKSRSLLQSFGAEKAKLLYNWLDAGEHPNYPQGRQDDTHFNELGARKMASLVLNGIRELKLDLSNRVAASK